MIASVNGETNGHVATEATPPKGKAERPTCGTCAFWQAPPASYEGRMGECRKDLGVLKTGVHVYPDQFCGEHSDFPAFLAATRPSRQHGSKAAPDYDPVGQAARYLEGVQPAISGHGGHRHAMDVARALVVGFGLTPEQALPTMHTWNMRCQPPWQEAELDRKLREAAQAHREQVTGKPATELYSVWIPILEPDEIRARRRAAQPADTVQADFDAAILHGNYRRLYAAVGAMLKRPNRAIGEKAQTALADLQEAYAALPEYDPFAPADLAWLKNELAKMTDIKNMLARSLHDSAMQGIAARHAVRDIVHELLMTGRNHMHDGNLQASSLVVSAALLGKLERLAYGEPEPTSIETLLTEDDVIAPSFEAGLIPPPAKLKPADPGLRQVDAAWFEELDEAIYNVVNEWPDQSQTKQEFDETIDRLKTIRAEGHTAYSPPRILEPGQIPISGEWWVKMCEAMEAVALSHRSGAYNVREMGHAIEVWDESDEADADQPIGPREIIEQQTERIRQLEADLLRVRAKSSRRGQTIHQLGKRIAELRQANPYEDARVGALNEQIGRLGKSFSEVIETGQRLFERAGINLGWNEDTQRLFREHKAALNKWLF